MTPEVQKVCAEVVRTVSSRYARSCWWLSIEDLQQEGWVVALQALRKPDMNESRVGGYVYQAVAKSLSRYCWSVSSIASANKPGRQLVNIYRCAVDQAAADEVDVEQTIDAYRSLRRINENREVVRKRFVVLYNRSSREKAPNPMFDAGVEVLLSGAEPADVASVTGLAVGRIYRETRKLKTLIEADRLAQAALEQISLARQVL
jgi:hypothetical protein